MRRRVSPEWAEATATTRADAAFGGRGYHRAVEHEFPYGHGSGLAPFELATDLLVGYPEWELGKRDGAVPGFEAELSDGSIRPGPKVEIGVHDAQHGEWVGEVIQGEQRQLWLDLFFEISTEPSSIAASRHLLYIGKKR